MKKRITAAVILTALLFTMCACKSSKSTRPFDYDLSKYLTLGQYEGIEYTYSVAPVTDDAVEEFINSEMSEKGYGEEKNITDRPVKNGDTVNMDFEGKIDGVAFEGGTATGYELVIGSNTLIPGFETGLIGAKLGQTLDLNLTFPENYGKDELNGKPVVFTVKVNSIKAKVYPALTDEIVKELGDKTSVDEYKQYANEQVQTTNEKAAADAKETEIWGKVVANATVVGYPDGEVDTYKALLLENYDQQAQSSYGMSYEELLSQAYNKTLADIDGQLVEQAQSAVKEYMTIVAIARAQGMDITDEEYESQSAISAGKYGYTTTEEFMAAIDEGQFYLSLLIDKVMDYVVANAVEVK